MSTYTMINYMYIQQENTATGTTIQLQVSVDSGMKQSQSSTLSFRFVSLNTGNKREVSSYSAVDQIIVDSCLHVSSYNFSQNFFST